MIVAAACLGIFLPSSMYGEISTLLSLCGAVGPALLLLIANRWSGWQKTRVIYLLVLSVIILISTLASPFYYIAWGAAAPYLLAFVILLTDLRTPAAVRPFRWDWLFLWVVILIDGLLLAMGFGILFESSPALGLIQIYYQSLHTDLYEQMVVWHLKPVTVFGAHSTAAFAYFSLFALNFKIALNPTPKVIWRLFCVASSIGFLVLNWTLESNTSQVMAVLASLLVMLKLFKPMPIQWRGLLLVAFLAGALVIAMESNLSALLVDDAGDNGFLARYASGGRLQGTYDYLAENNMMPIGFSYSQDISLGDNFIAEYVVRTSPLGYAVVLCLLWSWFRRHLDLPQAMAFFGFFLIADLAYPLLVYSRVAAALPFFVLVWRRLESRDFLGSCPRDTRRNIAQGGRPSLAAG